MFRIKVLSVNLRSPATARQEWWLNGLLLESHEVNSSEEWVFEDLFAVACRAESHCFVLLEQLGDQINNIVRVADSIGASVREHNP